MRKVRDASKERYWRKLIRRQAESGETIARFCAREGVSAHQFYWWRRTLASSRSASRRADRADSGDGESLPDKMRRLASRLSPCVSRF